MSFMSMSTSQTATSDTLRYYGSPYNGFVFSKELIERFFTGDPNDTINPGAKADYLIVLMGAQPADDMSFKEGNPTVVLVACNFDEVAKKFIPLDIEFPASEHPPTIIAPIEIQDGFPSTNKTTIQSFSVL